MGQIKKVIANFTKAAVSKRDGDIYQNKILPYQYVT